MITFVTVGAVGASLPFFGLKDASLWLDELATLYFSDPSMSPSRALTERMVTSIHPPAYYLLQNLWLRPFVDLELGARLPSAILGVGLVAVAWIFGRRSLSTSAACYLVALIVTSYAFIIFTREARNYALVFTLGLGQALLFETLLRRLRAARPLPIPPLLALGALSALNGFVHYYAFLFSGAVIGVLLLYAIAARRNRDAIRILALGASVFALNATYTLWHLGQAGSLADRWFPDSLEWYVGQTITFVWHVAGGHPGIISLLAAVAAGAVAVAVRTGSAAAWRHFGAPVLPHTLVVMLTVAFGLAISKLLAPLFTAKAALVTVPMVWLALALLFDAGLRSPVGWARLAAVAGAVASVAVGLPFALAFGGAVKEEWRASAAFVDGLEACRGATLPVAMVAENAEDWYGFYLRQPQAHRFVPVDEAPTFEPGGCPIRAWAVHDPDRPEVRRVIAELGDAARVVRFPHTEIWGCGRRSCRLRGGEQVVGAIVVLQEAPR